MATITRRAVSPLIYSRIGYPISLLQRSPPLPQCTSQHTSKSISTLLRRHHFPHRKIHTTPTLLRPISDIETHSILTAEREQDQVDVCVVGGGPAGLSAAIRLKQLANEAGNEDFRVLLLEKGGDMGAHSLAGAVLEPSAMNSLLPDWISEENPSRFEGVTPVTTEKMRFLTEGRSFWLPEPPQMRNHGNYIISLSQLVKWMAERAEAYGVEIYSGFAASEVLYGHDGGVKGVATNDLGIGRDGKPKESFQRGMEFHAKCTLFAEGCHGSLAKQIIKKFDLRRHSLPQTYGQIGRAHV